MAHDDYIGEWEQLTKKGAQDFLESMDAAGTDHVEPKLHEVDPQIAAASNSLDIEYFKSLLRNEHLDEEFLADASAF